MRAADPGPESSRAQPLVVVLCLAALLPVSVLHALALVALLPARNAPLVTPCLLLSGISLVALWRLSAAYMDGGRTGLARVAPGWWGACAPGVAVLAASLLLPLVQQFGWVGAELAEPLPAFWFGLPAVAPLTALAWLRSQS